MKEKPVLTLMVIAFTIVLFIIASHSSVLAVQPTSIKIDKLFSNSQVIFPFVNTERIYRLAISGSLQLYEDNSLIRVILVGDDFHEYLVYEAYPLTVDNNTIKIMNECEETCIIEGITPHSLKIDLIDASIQIDEITFTDEPLTLEMKKLEAQVIVERKAKKINKINENIKKKGLKWNAGETPTSKLSYEEKKKLFGEDKVPNLQGAEYYKGGIFEIKSNTKSTSPTFEADSTLIESFDWRNRHGANNPDSPYYDGDATGSGWITPIRNQGSCGSCWAFSAVGATEALANLYFNQHLDVDYDLDLSEQDVLSCSGGGSCKGGSPATALEYITDTGVVDEGCFPYTAGDQLCDNKCSDPFEIIRINKKGWIDPRGEEDIKRKLIDYGPLNFGVISWRHSIVLVGYDKDISTDETIWIIKNSWGIGWGENGYGKIKVDLSDMYFLHYLVTPVESLITPFEIACNDFDGDGYYNWGISDVKPASCPGSALTEKDCDDNNSSLGPFDADGHCVPIVMFEDVPPGYWAEDFIYKIYNAGITAGCSQNPFKYCPEDSVTRAQMAIFIGRGIHGIESTPPDATGIFADVPVSYWGLFADFIEQFYNDGITGGCKQDPLSYCPENQVTRAQMAVFLLRAKHGSSYTPPPATGIFSDVPTTAFAAEWIEQLYHEGITAGCSTSPLKYCPNNSVTRAQMAIFLVRTFGL